jgi:G6PDH family F420-dependent oxidoreductase
MCRISYHAAHEQFHPKELLRNIQKAEKAGFHGIHVTDHFHPWSTRQGNSSFLYSWMGTALESCKLPFSMVCTPGQRMHPTLLAQAIATLSILYPDRIIFELETGEAVNESITGAHWPEAGLRKERLVQCKHVIKELLTGKLVNFHGLIEVNNARLFSVPSKIPSLYCAALSERNCAWAGTWADGLLTSVEEDLTELKSKIRAFKAAAGNDKMPVHLHWTFSYGRTTEEAIDQAFDQWRFHLLDPQQLRKLRTPEEFDKAAAGVTKEQVCDKLFISNDMQQLKQRIEAYMELNPTGIHLHNVNKNQLEFLEDIPVIFH